MMEDIDDCNESYYDDNENWNDMEDINYIYVLDYSDATICEIVISNDDRNKEPQDIIEHYGCNINTCSWMGTKNRIFDISTLNDEDIKSDIKDW